MALDFYFLIKDYKFRLFSDKSLKFIHGESDFSKEIMAVEEKSGFFKIRGYC